MATEVAKKQKSPAGGGKSNAQEIVAHFHKLREDQRLLVQKVISDTTHFFYKNTLFTAQAESSYFLAIFRLKCSLRCSYLRHYKFCINMLNFVR